jgi:hypothetical protein
MVPSFRKYLVSGHSPTVLGAVSAGLGIEISTGVVSFKKIVYSS